MNEDDYIKIFSEGLDRYFNIMEAPDGSRLPIEDFQPGVREQLGAEWDRIIEEYRLMDEDLETEEIEFRFWISLDKYVNESIFLLDNGKWGAQLMRRIQKVIDSYQSSCNQRNSNYLESE